MITPVYAAILSLFYIALSVRTLLVRRRLRIAVGTGESEEMLRAMRVHANFGEYVPLTLLLTFMLEFTSTVPLMIHAVCLALTVGRISHAYGVSQLKENYSFRVFGMGLTFTSIGTAALMLLYVSF